AVYALGNIGGKQAVKALSDLLNAGPSRARHLAANALVNEGSPESTVLVVRAAEAATGRHQIEFLDALSGSRGPAIDALFLNLAHSESPDVRNRALQHLVHTGNPEGEMLALRALTDGSRNEQQAAIGLLG